MLAVELYKIVDAGHFWCKPSSRNKSEAESFYTLSGRVHDYGCKAEKQSNNSKSNILRKGKNCLVKRTSDKCWYRAKVLSILHTVNGPQARVLLVDLGERTMVPAFWVQEIPEEFASIPYQTMECVLSQLKPLTMTISYFDLTTTKQPGNIWDTSATEWFRKQVHGCSLQVDVQHIDDNGLHHVLLFATGPNSMVCLNDELVKNEYAILSKQPLEASQDKTDSSSSKDRDSLSEELKNIKQKMNKSLILNDDTSATVNGERSKYQRLTWSEDSESSAQGSENELGKQPISANVRNSNEPISAPGYPSEEERNKVRFMSARLPATGSKYFQFSQDLSKQPKPILKNSSGHSSGEDPQWDLYNQRRSSTPDSQRNSCGQEGLASHSKEDLKTPSSANAHDRNANLSNQRPEVYSNSNTGSALRAHYQDAQLGGYNENSMPSNSGALSVPDNSAFLQDHDVRLRGQSQDMMRSNKATSEQRNRQILPNDRSVFPQQNERQTSLDQCRNPCHSSSSTDQRKMSNPSFAPQTIQNEFQTNVGQYFNTGQPISSKRNQQGPPFPLHQTELPSNTGRSYLSQASTAQSSSCNLQDSSNMGLPFGQRNHTELRQSTAPYSSSGQSSIVQHSSSVHAEVSSSQQRQTWPGNNNNAPKYRQLGQSNNNTCSTSSSSQQNNQNFSSSFISHQAVPSNQNISPSSRINGPSSPFYPSSSMVQNPQQSIKTATSPVQPPRMGNTPPYGPNCMQSNNIHSNQTPHQGMSPQTSMYTPVSTSRTVVSPMQSMNDANNQAQREHFFLATSQKGNISSNTAPFSSQPQSTSVPQSRVSQQPRYTPYSTSEYQYVPTNQAQSSVMPQQGTQQIFLPKQSQYAQSVPGYQAQSKGIPPKKEQSLPQRQAQNLPTNTAGVLNDPNTQNSSPRLSIPISANQDLQLPPSQPAYNSQSSSEFPSVPNSQTQSTHLHQDHTQRYPPKQWLYSPMSTSQSPNVPTSQAKSTCTLQNNLQQQYAPQAQSKYPPIHSHTPEYQDVPTSKQSQSTAVPKQFTTAQSMDILRNTTPSQRLPDGEIPIDTHNNQAQSHPASNYPTSTPGISEGNTKFQSTLAHPNASQCILNDQLYSSDDQASSTQVTQHNVGATLSTPNSPVRTPSFQKSPTKSPRVRSSAMPNAKLCRVVNDVIVHGEVIPGSQAGSDLSLFPEGIQRGLRDLRVTKPTSFQANIWAAIMRGRDVFGIPESSSDNAMAYLAPIVTHLTQPETYSKLPLGNGALALILCEGWRKATNVYEQCRKLTKNVRKIRVHVVFGAGAEDECIPMLINGCEILIATIPCLLRMLRKKCTRLNKVCHIVFDDADILAEQQTESVKELMREYGALLQSQPNREAPRQCIAIGNKWTTGVHSLVNVYLGNPLVVIGNHIEAAMFCKVRQIVNYVSSSKRESELLRLLDNYTLNNEHEITIFASTAKDAERLAQMLEHYSFTILMAHEFLYPEQLAEVRRQWNTPHNCDSFLILVMTDGVIDKCNIRTATCVIHYDSAPTKKLFGKRMFCMAASYPSTQDNECLSLTIGTEHSRTCARGIKELVLRSGAGVPPTLEKICEFVYQEREEQKKDDELCTVLKAFGQCRDLLECKSRHTVFPDVDLSVLLPKSGIVKVLILAVLNASRYFVRILEHQNGEKEVDSLNYYSGATFLKLALDLNSVYTSRENRHVCSRIQLQKLCVVESEGSYYRAKIVQVFRRDPETNKALEVQVYFIDRGFYEYVPCYNLFEIAPQFVDIPYQAVEAYVCRVKPVDNDRHWTKKADRYVAQHIQGQELEGKVIMGLRNTIWLDPLVAKEHLKEINVTTNTFNARLDLFKEGFAVPNQEHVENLKKHFTSFVQLKDITGHGIAKSPSDSDEIETCSLSEEDYEMVKVSSIHTPELFYVRLYVNSDSLEDLVDEMNEDNERHSIVNHDEFSIGSLCLAKVNDDERWYRGKILSIRPDREYDVFFVDYGDREWVTADRIAVMRPEYLKFPFQAIECNLVNISPVGTQWTAEDAEGLWTLVEDKLLFAKVKSTSAALLAGTFRYAVELCDTSTERDLLLNHELVTAGHAQATLEYHKALFPEAFDSNNTRKTKFSEEFAIVSQVARQTLPYFSMFVTKFKEHYEEIPVLCLQLHRAQDSNTKLRYAQEIRNIVSENMKKKDDIRECGGVRCISHLLGVCKSEAVQEYIVSTLAFLATQNDLNCEEIRREGGLKLLCDLLSKAKTTKLQEHVTWAVKTLAASERNCDATREFGGIKNLCDLLASTGEDKVQGNICWAFVSLCSDNNDNCDTIRETGGLSTIFKLLETSRSISVLENATWAISLLAYNTRNKMFIGKEGGIEIIHNLIKTNQDGKILQNAVRSLKTLSSYNDENREIMCRLGMIDLMRRLSNAESQLPFDTQRICVDLIQRLLGRAPDVPLIEASSITSPLQEAIKYQPIAVTKKQNMQKSGEFVNGGDGDLPQLEDIMQLGRPTVHPMTLWSQTKRFVSLSIKLRGVQDKTTNITEKTFYFRTKHMDKLYELNLDLFATVIPKESRVHVRGSEVLVSLTKSQPGTWQRLLTTKEKLPFLRIDFDRWNPDSDSSGENETKQRVPTIATKEENKLAPRPYDDSSSDSSSLSSDEDDTRERIGLDFS